MGWGWGTIWSIARVMPCKNEGANLSLLARKIRQSSCILILPHILEAGIYMVVHVVHCTTLLVTSHIRDLVALKA